jgi:prepilin-type N-terminal cleavage/methylation domain-containing protein
MGEENQISMVMKSGPSPTQSSWSLKEGNLISSGKVSSGFTLIELIVVVVIIGLLATIVTPKYLELVGHAEEASEETFLGRLVTGIHHFSAKRYIEEKGVKTFPKVQSPLFDRVLSDVPAEWEYDQTDGKITHTRRDQTVKTWYYWTNADSTEFAIRLTPP